MKTNDRLEVDSQHRECAVVISRRRLLRALLISGGSAVTLGLLPATWATPVVETATLPPHAKASANAFNLSCQAETGFVGRRVPQNGQISQIKVNVPPIYPYNAELHCRVTTDDPHHTGNQFQTLSAFKGEDGAVYPPFDLLTEVNKPPIAVGSTITFTVSFADQATFLDDSCSTTITVGQPLRQPRAAAEGQPIWRKNN